VARDARKPAKIGDSLGLWALRHTAYLI
jgi:hypothetical protein